jgi:ferritin
MRGLAVATNYVHVAIEQGDGSLVFGHLEWFVKDKLDEKSELDSCSSKTHSAGRGTNKQRQKVFAEFEF